MGFITILEVSQKQAYIFASKAVKDNIVNSAVIARVLSPEYLSEVLAENGYADGENMVYSGGGHTILEFVTKEEADRCVAVLTKHVYQEYDGLQVFAKTIAYNDKLSPKENLKELTKELEKKKSVRQSFFRQGSYGIEALDSDTLERKSKYVSQEKKNVETMEYDIAMKRFTPEGFRPSYKFEDLGGVKNESNFISVVHIDGNGMGKRVEQLYDVIQSGDWKDTKKKLRDFSEGIDEDFKNAYKEMTEIVGSNIKSGKLPLAIKDDSFPIRRIITAGDDICFVTEGRIGLECARIFIEALSAKKNRVDGKGYAACAGVALVHVKYPFYKAYELAEMLCSNAKKYGANISPEDNGRNISSIDWHVEFGEMKDSLEEIRKDYITEDKNHLELRPYVVCASEKKLEKIPIAKRYSNFRRVIGNITANEGNYGVGKVKELRSALKQGETATRNYLVFNRMESIAGDNKPGAEELREEDLKNLFTGKHIENSLFLCMEDGKKHSILFDAIELMDTYLPIEGGVEA